MSLRTRLLLGILVANVAAFSVLATAVLRDVRRQERDRRAAEAEVRDAVVRHLGDLFVILLGEIDFDERARQQPFVPHVMGLEPWRFVRDAYVTNLVLRLGREVMYGDIELNVLGRPDKESEALRDLHLKTLVEQAYTEERPVIQDDLLAIPLFRGGTEIKALQIEARQIAAQLSALLASPTLRAGGAESIEETRRRTMELLGASVASLSRLAEADAPARREKWGAAYLRVAVPSLPDTPVEMTPAFLALAIGGGTAAGMALVYLLLHVLVLTPLGRVSQGARRVSTGDFRQPVPNTGREDEIDALITSFNRMMEEIAQARHHLESQVEEAVDRMRASEKRLVLSERLAAMGTLAAGIAHEINNPLGGMLNAVRSLRKRSGGDARTERYLDLLEDGLSRIGDVVQRVLRFSPSRRREGITALREIVEDAARFVRPKLHEGRAELQVDVDPTLRVRCDAVALGQVFLNLILNAVDAMEGPVRRIDVQAERLDGTIVVRVADTGKGMSEEQRSRAFDHFYTTKESGTGLGLSIVHQILHENGATISVESRLGEGTTFEIRLPEP